MLLAPGRRVIRRLAVSAVAAAFVLTQAPHVVRAVTVKTVVRISGDVGYQQSATSQFVPITGQQELPDNSFVVTRGNGVADIVMPDSSVIRVAQAAKIQVGAFHDPGQGENDITVLNGSFRFRVTHPAGGQSNYKFVTPTSQIAVRGTEGLGKVTNDVTQVSCTQASTPNDVRIAPVKLQQSSYLQPTASTNDLQVFLRHGDPLDEIKLAEMAPEQRLIAQVQVVFTALAQGFTATVTVNGVIVGQYVLSSAALGVGGTLSSVASGAAGAAGSSAISAGTSAASAAGAAGTAVVTGAAAAAAAGGLAAAASAANSGITTATPSPTPSPTASVSIIITDIKGKPKPQSLPVSAPTPPPVPGPAPPRH